MTFRRVIPLGALVLVGCSSAASGDSFDDEKVATTTAALDLGTSSTELDGLASADPAGAASHLATSKTEGCRTRTLDPTNPAVVHVILDACTGRFGKHAVSGELTVTFSSNPDGSLHAETTSNNLTVDGRPLTRRVSADIRLTGSTRYVTRHSEETGTNGKGESVTHAGDHVVVTDETTHCHTVNGTGHSVIAGSRTIDSTITSFQTCETTAGVDDCPTGTIDHVNRAKGKDVHETFDGSAIATIEVSKPKGDTSTTWNLDCTPR